MTLKRDIITAIVTLARLMKTEADKRARAHGMTRAQWTILLNLQRQPGLLQKELAELLEVEPITVARLVDRLESRGMVERRADPTDRRCWRLHLTDASRPLMSDIVAQITELADIVTEGLPDATLQTMLESLSSMRDAITAEARRSPAPEKIGGRSLEAPSSRCALRRKWRWTRPSCGVMLHPWMSRMACAHDPGGKVSEVVRLPAARDDMLWAVVARLGLVNRIADIYPSRSAALADRSWREQQVSAYSGFLRGSQQPVPYYSVTPIRRADLPKAWRPLPALGFLHGKLI